MSERRRSWPRGGGWARSLPCMSLMDSDMPLHSFLVYTLLLAAAVALITVWDRRTGRGGALGPGGRDGQ